MGMRRLRFVFAVCGASILIGVAAQPALAGSETTPASATHAKAGKPSAAHRSGKHQKAARPAPHTTTHKEQTKDLAGRPASGPTAPADKSLERPPMFGPLSFGVETDPKVKPRSLAGGEVDFEREPGLRSKSDPWFLGLSLKSPVSW
jgi:hypothetical protein